MIGIIRVQTYCITDIIGFNIITIILSKIYGYFFDKCRLVLSQCYTII